MDCEIHSLTENLKNTVVFPSSFKYIEPEVITPYDKSKITTIAVGVRLKEAQVQHFGGHSVYAGTGEGFRKETVTHTGHILDDRHKRLEYGKDIPLITLEDKNQLTYIFQDNGKNKPALTTTDKQQALARQNRTVRSGMETNPDETLYFDLHTKNICDPEDDLIHLKGSILEVNCMPENLKVNKVIIQYLGDNVYAGKDFNELDWSWLKNLHNFSTKGGQIFFEMRADEKTRQEKEPVLEALTEKLQTVKEAAQQYEEKWSWSQSAVGNLKKLLMADPEDEERAWPGLSNGLSEAKADLILAHMHPKASLPSPERKIREILTAKFKENGFNKVTARFFPKHSLIPTRFHDTVLIAASHS